MILKFLNGRFFGIFPRAINVEHLSWSIQPRFSRNNGNSIGFSSTFFFSLHTFFRLYAPTFYNQIISTIIKILMTTGLSKHHHKFASSYLLLLLFENVNSHLGRFHNVRDVDKRFDCAKSGVYDVQHLYHISLDVGTKRSNFKFTAMQ